MAALLAMRSPVKSSNLGAVANAFAALLFFYTVLMLEQKEANTFSFRNQ
jgi:hypothetical protein